MLQAITFILYSAVIHQIMKKIILVISTTIVSLICHSQKPEHTLKKYFFNNYIQRFDYSILTKVDATTITSKSNGQDRHTELEDHFNYSYANDSSDFSYKVIAGRTLPPPIRIIN